MARLVGSHHKMLLEVTFPVGYLAPLASNGPKHEGTTTVGLCSSGEELYVRRYNSPQWDMIPSHPCTPCIGPGSETHR